MSRNDAGVHGTDEVIVMCPNGHRFAATQALLSRPVPCPTCGVATNRQPTRSPASKVDDEPSGTGFPRLVMWGIPSVGIVAAILVVFLVDRSGKIDRTNKANAEVRDAAAAATDWLKDGTLKAANEVESRLAAALEDRHAAEKGDAAAVLDSVCRRRSDLNADLAFTKAREQIDAGKVADAIVTLRDYLSQPHGLKRDEAKTFMAEAEIAVSDSATLETLTKLDAEGFAAAGDKLLINDGRVTHPKLLEVRRDTIRRNVETAAKHREEIEFAKKAEEERRLEAERARQRNLEVAESRRIEAQKAAERSRRTESYTALQAEILAKRQDRERRGKNDFDYRKARYAKDQMREYIVENRNNILTHAGGDEQRFFKILMPIHGSTAVSELADLYMKDKLTGAAAKQVFEKAPVDKNVARFSVPYNRVSAIKVFLEEYGAEEAEGSGLTCKWMFEEAKLRILEDAELERLKVDRKE